MSEGQYGTKNQASLQLTFNKKSQGESEAVHASRHLFGCSENQCYSRDPKEQIHGAVLPVHQLDPWASLVVVKVGMWPIHHKLFNHNTWRQDNIKPNDVSQEQLLESLCVHMDWRDNWPTNEAKIWNPPSKQSIFLKKGGMICLPLGWFVLQ